MRLSRQAQAGLGARCAGSVSCRRGWRGWREAVALAVVVACAGCSPVFLAPSLPNKPVYVYRDVDNYWIANPCAIGIRAARVLQPSIDEPHSYAWTALAASTDLSPKIAFPNPGPAYIVEEKGVHDPDQPSIVVAMYSDSDTAGAAIQIDLADLDVGEIAYHGGIIPADRWAEVKVKDFGC